MAGLLEAYLDNRVCLNSGPRWGLGFRTLSDAGCLLPGVPLFFRSTIETLTANSNYTNV